MCHYCETGALFFKTEKLDLFPIEWIVGKTLEREDLTYSEYGVFIDRGFIRYSDLNDSDCMDHGERIKIKYCPFCGEKLNQDI